MLPRQNRLAAANDIRLVFHKGRAFYSPFWIIRFFGRRSALVSRATVVVSNKVHKRANKRNRIKRIAREVLRLGLSHISRGDWMLIARPSITKLSAIDLSLETKRSLKEIDAQLRRQK